MNRIILFGAGKNGQNILKFLDHMGTSDIVDSFCVSNPAEAGGMIEGRPVLEYEKAKIKKLPFVITTGKYSAVVRDRLEKDGCVFFDEIGKFLQQTAGMDPVKVNRDYCAFFHIDAMDVYFDSADSDHALGIFWGIESPFHKMFEKLDLTNVIELACGRGRHVDKYYDKAGLITLVDILEKNIEYCKERFAGREGISYYQNNGYDLSELRDGGYTAIFTYDSMVHFEMFDIFSYLKETYRVLKPGGMGLFHHSNLMTDYSQTFENAGNPDARNFMSKELFAYLAYKAGLEIVEQQIVDWTQPEMDCITLVRKSEYTG